MRLQALLVRNTHELLDYLCWQVLSLGTLFFEWDYDVKLEALDYQFLYSTVVRNSEVFRAEGVGARLGRVRLDLKRAEIFFCRTLKRLHYALYLFAFFELLVFRHFFQCTFP